MVTSLGIIAERGTGDIRHQTLDIRQKTEDSRQQAEDDRQGTGEDSGMERGLDGLDG
jgi:hypothetical protein